MSPSHGCGAEWAGAHTAHCCGLKCHRTFSSENVWESHRLNGECLDPATLLDKKGKPRFETFTDRVGCEVWRSTKRMSDDARARLRAKDARQP